MALIPGDGHPYHSRILWWQEEGSATFAGGQWGWINPGNINCTSYPDSAFASLGLPNPIVNIFCAGFTQLPDGRLMVVGGTETATENGMKHVRIFTPGTYSDSGTWAIVDSMADRRWYPTATVLSDGRILATSGSKYPHIDVIGGRTNGAAFPVDTTITRFGIAGTGIWDSPIVPTRPQVVVGQNWPPPLTGASMAAMPGWGNQVYFGGRDASGLLTQ